ncbi:MAG: hydrolase [Acidimicrobiales bacterium]|nr:MAG: hydrolase [Acidimicrobiales bacterium]
MPADSRGERAFYQASRNLAQRCQQQAGELLPHINTVNSARDLDLLRRAVGDAKLTYHGLSYDTHLGAIYANLFPRRIRAMVLDGAMDFVGNATGNGFGRTKPVDVRQNTSVGTAQTFDSFLDQCVQAGAKCAFAAGGNVHVKWGDLTRQAKRHPIEVIAADGSTTTYTYSKVISDVAGGLGQPDTWPDLATTLEQIYQASKGVQLRLPAMQPSDIEKYFHSSQEASNAIQCADALVPRNEAIYTHLAVTEDRRVPYFGRIGVFRMMPCAYWPTQAVKPYAGPWNRWTASPILIINNRFDPATSLEGAQRGLAQLARGRLLVVEGAGHTTLAVHSTCAEKAKQAYLISGVLPQKGTTCSIDSPPFS